MLYLIFIAVAFFLYFTLWKDPIKRKRYFSSNHLIFIGIVLTVVLIATGRLHWIWAGLLGGFAVLRGLVPIVIRMMPLMLHWLEKKHRNQPSENSTSNTHHSTRTPSNNSRMSHEQALRLLGLERHATQSDILNAYKRLMQKVHPDRGGSAELAAQLNEAREVLLNS
ncbi:MAG: J domain-containing protein [Pseudomonadota bacterium]